MLPLALALSTCSHTGCWRPAPAAVPPLPPNATSHLPCYQVKQAPKHPEWPTGNLGKVNPVSHRFQGFACIPDQADPERAAEVVAVHIKVDGAVVLQLEANISRPDLRYKTPCGGPDERHGFAGLVPAAAMSGKHQVRSDNPIRDTGGCCRPLADVPCICPGPQLAAFAVNRVPNAPMVLLGKQAICDGKPCGPVRPSSRVATLFP